MWMYEWTIIRTVSRNKLKCEDALKHLSTLPQCVTSGQTPHKIPYLLMLTVSNQMYW